MASKRENRGAKPEKHVKKHALTPEMEARKWKPGQSGNPAGRPKKRVLSEAYRDILERPLPFDPKHLREHVETMIGEAATGAEVAAVLMYANLFKANAVSVSAAVELRKATEGDTLTLNDERTAARKRMAELGLTEADVWKRDPALAEYLVSIGAIEARAPADGAPGADRGPDDDGPAGS